MSSLQNQVLQLKNRVRQLQQQITQRARNYLLQVQHLRKNSKTHLKSTIKVQKTDINHQSEIINSIRLELQNYKIQNVKLQEQLQLKSKLLLLIENQKKIEECQTINADQNHQILNKSTQNSQACQSQFKMSCLKISNQLSIGLYPCQDIIDQKQSQIQDLKTQFNNQIQSYKLQNDQLYLTINELRIVNEGLMEQSRIPLQNIQLLKQENQLLNDKYNTLHSENIVVEEKLKLSQQYINLTKHKYQQEIKHKQNLNQELVKLKDKVNNYEWCLKQNQEKLNRIQQINKQKRSIETNTQPIDKIQQQTYPKTSVHLQVPTHHTHSNHSSHHIRHKETQKKPHNVQSIKHLLLQQQMQKQNDIINQQLIRKQQECKKLFAKIDEVQKQNNKLIGVVQSQKRDIQYEKEAQKILNITINQQKNVIQNQKNTILRLQKDYEIILKQLDVKVDEQSKDIELTKKRSNKDNNIQSQEQGGLSNLKQGSVINNWDTESRQRFNNINEQTDYGSRTPIARIIDLDQSQFASSSGIKQKHQDLSSSVQPRQLHRQESNKYQKKLSSKTYQLKQDLSEFSSMKSSRIFTSQDLKINIKNILDNSVLLGKGLECLQLIKSILKQVQTYTTISYYDIFTEIDKKKQLQKSAFNTQLIKQITQLTKIRTEYQQKMQQIREQHQQVISRKKFKIKQLKQKKQKLEWTNQQLKERVEYLEDEMEKFGRKVGEYQKESKKNIIIDNDHVQKFKQQKGFLTEKIQKYQHIIGENDSIKKKLFFDNERQKTQLFNLKQRYLKVQASLNKQYKSKQKSIKQVKQQSQQFINILIQSKLQQQKQNKTLLSQLRQKQISLQQMAQQMAKLHHQIKQRQNDLLEIGNQVKQIRSVNSKLSNSDDEDEINQSRLSFRRQQANLRYELKYKQQMLTITQKQISRHKTQIHQLQKQLQLDKDKTINLLRSNRQMADQINTLNNTIQFLSKKIAVLSQEQSYQIEKMTNQFQQIIQKICQYQIKKKQNKNKIKMNSHIFKSINSQKTEKQQNKQRNNKENIQMKQILKLLTQSIYETYCELPHTSQTTSLFQAQTKQQLFNQLKDIRRFAQNYRSLKQSIVDRIQKVQYKYKMLVKQIMKNIHSGNRQFLIKVIDQLITSNEQKDILKSNVDEMIPLDEIVQNNYEQQKQSNPHRTSLEGAL